MSTNEQFDEALAEFNGYAAAGQLNRTEFLGNLIALEQNCLRMVGEGVATAYQYAGAMRDTFTAAGEATVRPPFTQVQTAEIAGKVSTYAAMTEATQPKETRPKRATDTEKVQTDAVKPS